MALPFPDDSFDGATMGFSLRNVADIDRVLREILRVLKPGARFVNLDVSKAPNKLWKRMFDVYFYHVVPLVGAMVGGSREAYTYLPNSLTNHPNAGELRDRFTRAGFASAYYLAARRWRDRRALREQAVTGSPIERHVRGGSRRRPSRFGRSLFPLDLLNRQPDHHRSREADAGSRRQAAASADHAAGGGRVRRQRGRAPAPRGLHGTDPRRHADPRRRRRQRAHSARRQRDRRGLRQSRQRAGRRLSLRVDFQKRDRGLSASHSPRALGDAGRHLRWGGAAAARPRRPRSYRRHPT